MIEILRGTPDQVCWQATLVVHTLAPTASIELAEDDTSLVISVRDHDGAVVTERAPVADLPAEIVRHAAARLAAIAVRGISNQAD